jgi:PhnB protein
MNRFSPNAIGGTTGRTLLVAENPEHLQAQAVATGTKQLSAVREQHGWRLGRVIDPYGHEWEIGKPLGAWPPSD